MCQTLPNDFSHIKYDNLSCDLQNKIENWNNSKKDIKRIDWNYYFMSLAWIVRLRSPDARTKCGTVIVDQNNLIISTGYNGMISNIDDSILPNYNEDKYPFFIHGEINAILNASKQGKSTKNSIFYITGEPCLHCLQSIWQCGGIKIYYGNNQAKMTNNIEYKENIRLFRYLTNNKLEMIKLDFDENLLKKIILENN